MVSGLTHLSRVCTMTWESATVITCALAFNFDAATMPGSDQIRVSRNLTTSRSHNQTGHKCTQLYHSVILYLGTSISGQSHVTYVNKI